MKTSVDRMEVRELIHYAGTWTKHEKQLVEQAILDYAVSGADEAETPDAPASWTCLCVDIEDARYYLVCGLDEARVLRADSITELAQRIHDHYRGHQTRVGAASESRGGLPPVRLRRVTEFIQKHLDHDLTIIKLAEVAHMSPYHFARLFKASVGEAPRQYVTRCRMEEAARMLRQADLKITEVARLVGYSNASHFAKLFRRHAGNSPMEYRQCWGT